MSGGRRSGRHSLLKRHDESGQSPSDLTCKLWTQAVDADSSGQDLPSARRPSGSRDQVGFQRGLPDHQTLVTKSRNMKNIHFHWDC